MIRNSPQRGSIIVYAMLTMATMLAIGLSLSSLFVNKLRLAGQARDSIVAIYTADSVVEACLYSARNEVSRDLSGLLANGATFAITNLADLQPVPGNDCSVLGSTSFGFRATGTYHGVQRTLEISQ